MEDGWIFFFLYFIFVNHKMGIFLFPSQTIFCLCPNSVLYHVYLEIYNWPLDVYLFFFLVFLWKSMISFFYWSWFRMLLIDIIKYYLNKYSVLWCLKCLKFWHYFLFHVWRTFWIFKDWKKIAESRNVVEHANSSPPIFWKVYVIN